MRIGSKEKQAELYAAVPVIIELRALLLYPHPYDACQPTMSLINIAIVSDSFVPPCLRPYLSVLIPPKSVCPFCYLGLRKLQTAIESFKAKSPETRFALKFEPFLVGFLLLWLQMDRADREGNSSTLHYQRIILLISESVM